MRKTAPRNFAVWLRPLESRALSSEIVPLRVSITEPLGIVAPSRSSIGFALPGIRKLTVPG